MGKTNNAVMAGEGGTVHTFFASKGYGFIVPDGGGTDVFVHQSAIQTQGFRVLYEGQRVQFEMAMDAGVGRRRAARVNILPSPQTQGQTVADNRTAKSGSSVGRKYRHGRFPPDGVPIRKHDSRRKGNSHYGKSRGGSVRCELEDGWGTAPSDIMWVICLQLSHPCDLGNMRLVCHHWRRTVGASIVDLRYSVLTPRIQRAFPLISSLDLSNRKPWEADMTERMMAEGLESLPKLGNLASLNFAGWPDLKDKWLEVVSDVPRLTALDVSRCTNVTDQGWRSIAEISKLEELHMQGCWRLRKLKTSSLSSLTFLNLSGCVRVSNSALGSMSSLVRLETLDLSLCSSVTGAGLRKLACIESLTKIDLSEMKHLGDEDAKGLGAVTSLTELTLGECALTDVGISSLAGLTRLHSLDLMSLPLLGMALSVLRTLTWLRCESCYNMDDDTPFFIAQLSNLQALALPSCIEIGSDGIANLVILTGLTELDLSDVPELDDDAIEHLSGLKALTSLDLSGAHWGGFTEFTDNGVLALQEFPELVDLKLSRWAQLSDIGLSMLQVLTNLEDVDLSWCKGITTEGVRSLQSLPKLAHLDVSWCLGLDGKKVEKMLPAVDITT
ncbi:hypothetical protein BSKO_11813 [Bryopsis sp. KO-2023]|nr:hypothetical protein BSKO_11813 [Bryopsis sp. KO-2023]